MVNALFVALALGLILGNPPSGYMRNPNSLLPSLFPLQEKGGISLMAERDISLPTENNPSVSLTWDLSFPKKEINAGNCPTTPSFYSSPNYFWGRRRDDLSLIKKSPWKDVLQTFGGTFYLNNEARFFFSRSEYPLAQKVANQMKKAYIAPSECSEMTLFHHEGFQENKVIRINSSYVKLNVGLEPVCSKSGCIPQAALDLHELWHVEEDPWNNRADDFACGKHLKCFGEAESLVVLREALMLQDIATRIGKPFREMQTVFIPFDQKYFSVVDIVDTYKGLLKSYQNLAVAFTSPESIHYLTGLSLGLIQSLEDRMEHIDFDMYMLRNLEQKMSLEDMLFLIDHKCPMSELNSLAFDVEKASELNFLLSHKNLLHELLELGLDWNTLLYLIRTDEHNASILLGKLPSCSVLLNLKIFAFQDLLLLSSESLEAILSQPQIFQTFLKQYELEDTQALIQRFHALRNQNPDKKTLPLHVILKHFTKIQEWQKTTSRSLEEIFLLNPTIFQEEHIT